MTLLDERWATGQLVGRATHALVVRVRRGVIKRDYQAAQRLDVNAPVTHPVIFKGHTPVWCGEWVPLGPWLTLPNTQSAKHGRDFAQKGSSTCTVLMDNIVYKERVGVAGVFHDFKRGYFAPSRGTVINVRPQLWTDAEWDNVLNGGYQIELWEGYGVGDEVTPLGEPDPETHSCAPVGGAITRTWTGIIEDVDLESHPDHITLTARDFGVLFTDQRLQDKNKSPECLAPITFADRKQTLGVKQLTGPATTLNGTTVGAWWFRSVPYDTGDAHWWYEQTAATGGHFEEAFVRALSYTADRLSGFPALSWDGQEGWLSVYVGPGGGMMDDGMVTLPEGWVDLGLGAVDGLPYVAHIPAISTSKQSVSLGGHTFDLPPGSIFRLTVTRLPAFPGAANVMPWLKDLVAGKHYAMVELTVEVFGTDPRWPPYDASAGIPYAEYLYGPDFGGVMVNPNYYPGMNADYWILTEDAADVVQMLCVWAGFREWRIERFGWTLQYPMQFGEDKFFMDVIDDIVAQGDFVFYMDAPTDDDRSIGVPCFEQQTAMMPVGGLMIELTDHDLLEAAQIKWDLSNLPGVLRYRGNPVDDGVTYDQDLVPAYQGVYYPPWSPERQDGRGVPRTGGVMRHFLQSIGTGFALGLDSNEQCTFACVLAAIQYGLQMCTGQVQIPGRAGFTLNRQISVIDEGSGINSRMWVASVESDHSMGQQGKWTMVISGAYIDIEDMDVLADDYDTAYLAMVNARQADPTDTTAPIALDYY